MKECTPKIKDRCFICGKPAKKHIAVDTEIKGIPLCNQEECYSRFIDKIFNKIKHISS